MTETRKLQTLHTKSEHNIIYTRVDALRADDPLLNVEPAADNNVMKVTEDCLFMRMASGSIYGGRRSMSWWAAIVTIFTFFFFSLIEYWGYTHDRDESGYSAGAISHYLENWYYPVGITAAFFLSCFWIFIPWRTQLPIIFNRKTRQITCMIQGKLVSQHWNNLDAYIKDVNSFAVGGAPINEGLLTLVFPFAYPSCHSSHERLRISIYGTQDTGAAAFNRGIYGAAMVWEYIRLYMRDGAAAVPLPDPIARYHATSIRDCIDYMNPCMPFKYRVWWKLLVAILLAPVLVPLLTCVMLGDIFYLWLDRTLPRRKWPQALIDACDGVWDGKDD
ncbi:hypothetical protein [Pseudomonas sp. R5(2019)]|uniref:hypothetical protein n=1 Tax=Pseudomonas sp. R5(2019) TaxID=2697566 RepID=UPI001412E2D3|nr:hypothetical protein [Pseudomonas sp. R5(2019)]NBA98346.1 hypothetical protein [Pseudomonas sp. R5(2019)]